MSDPPDDAGVARKLELMHCPLALRDGMHIHGVTGAHRVVVDVQYLSQWFLVAPCQVPCDRNDQVLEDTKDSEVPTEQLVCGKPVAHAEPPATPRHAGNTQKRQSQPKTVGFEFWWCCSDLLQTRSHNGCLLLRVFVPYLRSLSFRIAKRQPDSGQPSSGQSPLDYTASANTILLLH